MKKCIFLVVAMAVCSTAMADLKIRMNTSPGLPYIVNHVSGGPSWFPSSYKTFCVEKTVTFGNNNEYWATIDEDVYEGGPGTVTPNALSETVQKIYAAYRNNAISSSYNLGDIQNSIWNERGYNGVLPIVHDNLANHVLSLAPTDIAGWQNVRALNLWGSTNGVMDKTKDRQSQLVMVPVPGAYFLGALGLGVANWRLRRRRLA